MDTTPRIYAVIVSWNAALLVRRALTSLRTSTIPVHAVVVDNASKDQTRTLVSAEFPEALLLPLPKNHGFGAAANHGIHHALSRGAEYVLLLNQDAAVFPDTIEILLGVMASQEDIGIASPLHLSPDTGRLEPLFCQFVSSISELLSDALLGRMRNAYDIGFVNAAVWLVRRMVFERVGGFDPIFFMYGEDNDYCERVLFHNFRICIVPSARAWHAGGSLPGVNEPFNRMCMRATSRAIYHLKRPAHRFSLSFLSCCLIWAKQALVLLMNGSFKDLAADWVGLLRAFGQVLTIQKHYRICRSQGRSWLDT